LAGFAAASVVAADSRSYSTNHEQRAKSNEFAFRCEQAALSGGWGVRRSSERATMECAGAANAVMEGMPESVTNQSQESGEQRAAAAMRVVRRAVLTAFSSDGFTIMPLFICIAARRA
jgi:hypothetical protein